MTLPKSKSIITTLLKSVSAALACIDAKSPIPDEGVHELRKQLKRTRAALRLLRPSIGDEVYRRENRVLRDASRAVSPLRDARAQVDVLDALRERKRDALTPEALALLSTSLLQRLGRTHRQFQSSSPTVRKAIRNLKGAQRRLSSLSERESSSRDIKKGLRKIYRQARNAYEAARARPTPVSLHAWRKKTKYLNNAVDCLDVRKSSRPAIASKRSRRLGTWLGEDHDLAVLSDAIERHASEMPPSVRRELSTAIHDRFVKLCAKSLRLGAKTYARRPKKALARASA
jgi:CHAD domain-containing protein